MFLVGCKGVTTACGRKCVHVLRAIHRPTLHYSPSQFHMARTQAIFDWIFKLDTKKYELYFLSSPNVGLSNEAVQARNTKERSSLEKVKTYATMYRSMGAVWAFLHEKHALYTAEALVKRAEAKTAPETPELIKKSYGGGSRK